MIRPGAMFGTLIASVFRKPATHRYPAARFEMPANFRGQIGFIAKNCIGCRMCMRDCPADAIEIRKVGEKRFEARFDLGRCIYCAQCVDSCPKSALEATDRYELAGYNQDQLKAFFEAAPAPPAASAAQAAPQEEPSPKEPVPAPDPGK
ncbi:MAG: 4Fe-4S binding protein [bacterium]|nr:4Fe-4S binding protein [bacterium]